MIFRITVIFLAVGIATLTGCSESGTNRTPVPDSEMPGSDTPSPGMRPPLSTFNLPEQSEELVEYTLVEAFPALSFSDAIYARGVPGETRLIVAEQHGVIKAFENSEDASESTVVLDFSSSIVSSGEQGLIGVAFDPEFTVNRYVYLHYSRADPRRSVISRMLWRTGDDRIDVSSEEIILEVGQPYSNHNGGMLEFGPDGYLYIALGDGGDGGDPHNHGQDRSTLLGNLLRIDVHPQAAQAPYAIPPDNPFVNESGVRPEIYAYGLRNPFRFSFDRQTGALWLGDVGQGQIEEINLIESGGNYGWRVFEGTLDFNDSLNTLPDTDFIPPVFEYDHSEGVSVIGGYVYRGTQIQSLVGLYLYADFGSGTIWALEHDGNTVVSNTPITNASNPSSFGETNDGELLIVSRSNGLFKLQEIGGIQTEQSSSLSDTGLFSDLVNMTPASGLIMYEPNHPFWSDGAEKQRWIGIPDDQTIGFTENDWTFPVGTVAVKHFEIELTENDPQSTRKLETRVLQNTSEGWQGFTYRWNSDGSDAELISARESETLTISTALGETREILYTYPSRTDCQQCHTDAAGHLLGPNTAQMNKARQVDGNSVNQLDHLDSLAYFNGEFDESVQYQALAAVDDESATISARARAYLDVNCSNCHRPGGPAVVGMDLRVSTPIENMNIVDVAPTAGGLEIIDARIVAAGDKSRSVLWQRMQRMDGFRMPSLSSNVIDQVGVDLIGRWIDGL